MNKAAAQVLESITYLFMVDERYADQFLTKVSGIKHYRLFEKTVDYSKALINFLIKNEGLVIKLNKRGIKDYCKTIDFSELTKKVSDVSEWTKIKEEFNDNLGELIKKGIINIRIRPKKLERIYDNINRNYSKDL